MNSIRLSVYDEESVNTEMNIRVEFGTSASDVHPSLPFPSTICATAQDVAECDAASTCASDSDSVVFFDQYREESVFVCGSSVILRNLHPSILSHHISNAMESLGIMATINCPSFQVCDSSSGIREFNFGFSTLAFSNPEEATLVNFMIQTTGIEELLYGNESPASEASDEKSWIEVMEESVTTTSQISLKVESSKDISLDAAETIVREYLNGYGEVDSIIVTPYSSSYRVFGAVCMIEGNIGPEQRDRRMSIDAFPHVEIFVSSH